MSKLSIAVTFLAFFFLLPAPGDAAAPPANDLFSSAAQITGTSGSLANGSNVGASPETGEPDHGGDGLGPYASIWFSWTAPADSIITFDTFGSSFDTVLSAYTGTAVNSLTLIAQNDDAGQGSQSLTGFPATAGTTYYIAVDGFDVTETGAVTLSWSTAPAITNDDFSNAEPLTGTKDAASSNTFSATWEIGEPDHGGDGLGPYASIWFSWTAPADTTVTFDTFGSNFDTVLSAYTGTAVKNLTLVAQNDDATPDLSQSRITFAAAAGTTYYIAVDGYDETAKGSVTLKYPKKFPWPAFLPAITAKTRP